MARFDPTEIVPMVLQRWNDEFSTMNYAVSLGNAFEITTPLSAIQQEAGAKGMGVIVMVALVPLDYIFGKPDIEGETTDEPQPQPIE